MNDQGTPRGPASPAARRWAGSDRERHREDQHDRGDVPDHAGGDVSGQDRRPGHVQGPEPVDDPTGQVGGHAYNAGVDDEPGAQQHDPGHHVGHIAGAGLDGPPNR